MFINSHEGQGWARGYWILYAYYQLSVLETNHMSGDQVTILLSSGFTRTAHWRQTDRPAASSPDSKSVNQLYRNLDLSLSAIQMSHSPDLLTRRHESHSSELVQILARTLSSVRQSEIQSTNIASPNCKHLEADVCVQYNIYMYQQSISIYNDCC